MYFHENLFLSSTMGQANSYALLISYNPLLIELVSFIKDLNAKLKTIKLLEESIGELFQNMGMSTYLINKP